MAQAIGTVGATLGIIWFSEVHFGTSLAESSVMRIAVGLNNDLAGDSTFSGDAPVVRTFNNYGEFLGKNTSGIHIDEGSFIDIYVDQENTQQPSYALLTGNEGVCIAYATHTWPDQQLYGWVGNWGKDCGVKWYYSGIVVDNHLVDCTWLDNDGTATDVTGIKIHFPEFNDKGNGFASNETDYYCKNTPVMQFETIPDPRDILIWDIKNDPERRSTFVPRKMSHRLQKSRHAAHSATKLCESATSSGPDFVSYEEGKFCDMDTRTIWPICETESDRECFDVDAGDFRVVKRMGKREVSALAGAKNYTRVAEWA